MPVHLLGVIHAICPWGLARTSSEQRLDLGRAPTVGQSIDFCAGGDP